MVVKIKMPWEVLDLFHNCHAQKLTCKLGCWFSCQKRDEKNHPTYGSLHLKKIRNKLDFAGVAFPKKMEVDDTGMENKNWSPVPKNSEHDSSQTILGGLSCRLPQLYSSNWSKSIQPKVLWSKSPGQKPRQRRNCELNHVTSQLFKSLLDIRNIWTYFPNFQGASHTKIKLSYRWKGHQKSPRYERWKFLHLRCSWPSHPGFQPAWSKFPMSLRKPQHTPGTYPRPPTNGLWRNSFHFGIWGFLGYAPRVCWGFLRMSDQKSVIPWFPLSFRILLSSSYHCLAWMFSKWMNVVSKNFFPSGYPAPRKNKKQLCHFPRSTMIINNLSPFWRKMTKYHAYVYLDLPPSL